MVLTQLTALRMPDPDVVVVAIGWAVGDGVASAAWEGDMRATQSAAARRSARRRGVRRGSAYTTCPLVVTYTGK
jgi:hypothetical protein